MPSFGDSAFLVLLALMLFGPKKLPVLARQLGKLMADFRRASNEFRTQMEEELRISEQADRQKEIAAIEAAAPPTPALDIPEPEHPHLPPPEPTFLAPEDLQSPRETQPEASTEPPPQIQPDTAPAPLPIASSGTLNIMPPSTGLPIANTSLAPLLNSIPEVAATPSADYAEPIHTSTAPAESTRKPNGAVHDSASETEARPWMI